MRARAAGVEETRRRILDATYRLSTRRRVADIGLEAVADEAGVSVQTVLRQFGSKAGLVEATSSHVAAQVTDERRVAPGDVEEGLRLLVEHYEKRGDAVLLLLEQEHTEPALGPVVARGRAVHRDWVGTTFAPVLDALPEADRAERTDLLVVATDVYAWKLLRHDLGLSRAQTQQRLAALVARLL